MADVISFVITAEYIDCYHHVHYKNYLNIFESACVKFFSKRWIAFADTESQNAHFVTRHLEIEYFHELLLGDSIKIYTNITRVGKTSVALAHSIVRGDKTATTCKRVFVLVDNKTRLKTAISEELCLKLLSEYIK